MAGWLAAVVIQLPSVSSYWFSGLVARCRVPKREQTFWEVKHGMEMDSTDVSEWSDWRWCMNWILVSHIPFPPHLLFGYVVFIPASFRKYTISRWRMYSGAEKRVVHVIFISPRTNMWYYQCAFCWAYFYRHSFCLGSPFCVICFSVCNTKVYKVKCSTVLCCTSSSTTPGSQTPRRPWRRRTKRGASSGRSTPRVYATDGARKRVGSRVNKTLNPKLVNTLFWLPMYGRLVLIQCDPIEHHHHHSKTILT